MFRKASGSIVVCLFATVCVTHLSSAAVVRQPVYSHDAAKSRPSDIETVTQSIKSGLQSDKELTNDTPYVKEVRNIRSSRVGDESMDAENGGKSEVSMARDYIESLVNSNTRDTELDIAIEKYISNFYSDMLVLIQKELSELEEEASKPNHRSHHGRHISHRRKTRPKRSLDSILFRRI